MRWKVLAGGLGVVLLAAIVFAWWGVRLVPSPEAEGPGSAENSAPLNGSNEPGTPSSPSEQVPPSGTAAPSRASPPPVVVPAQPGSGGTPSGPTGSPSSVGGPGLGAPPARRGGSDAAVPFPIDKDGIKAAIGEKLPQVRECYEGWLEANPTLAGSVKVAFTIDLVPDSGLGGVTQISVLDGGLDHFALQGCVMNVFQELSFEPPENGPVKVNYPLTFAFDPGDGGA